jgi:hypothetical protein
MIISPWHHAGNKDARMIKSHRSNRPHFVAPGRGKAQFVCESTCPSFSAHKICSHCIVAAHSTGQLQMYLNFLSNSKSREKSYTKCAKTDMPRFPEKKGGVGPAQRKKTPPVTEHTERQYATPQVPVRIFFVFDL